MRIEAIFFDFWETLFGFLTPEELEQVRRRRIKEFSRILSLPPDRIEGAFSQLMVEINRERGATGIEVTLHQLLDRLLKRLGVRAPINRLWDIYSEAVYQRLPGPLPGAVELLGELKKRDIKQAIISNTIHGHIERRLLQIHGLNDLFDLLLFSSEVRFRKPRREIFEMALNKLKVKPYRTLHVGDSPETDVLGAHLAGVWSVYYDPGGDSYPENLPRSHFTINHLLKLLEIAE